MTGKSGKKNKQGRKAPRKFNDAGLKATSRKQARYDKQQAWDAHRVEIPRRLSKLLRQNQKEYR